MSSEAFEIGKNRIETLSDGIFAIVMTLLILELHVPNLPPTAPNVEVTPALLALWPKFVSYLVTFVSLGVFWIGHHIMYHAIRRADRTLLWLNIFFFMFVSLLPFSTSFLNAFPRAFIAPFFFGANLAVIGWLLFFQWIYVNSQPDMLAGFVSAEYRSAVTFRMLMVPVATTLTAFICFWSVGISLAIYLLLLPLYMLPGTFAAAQTRNLKANSCAVLLLTALLSFGLDPADSYAESDYLHRIDVVRLDPRFDKLVPFNVTVEKIAGGHRWVEGPLWNRKKGFLLFSDIPTNSIYKWQPGKGESLFSKPSGYTGKRAFDGAEPGSNGLTYDPDGRLVLAEHGDRRVARLEQNGRKTTLVDRYEGRRINSPNDVVFSSNGDLYFTDPPFGLPKAFEDPRKELPFQGVYRRSKDGKLSLIIKDIKAPNGIALSPDERKLYVSDVNYERSAWLIYDLQPDGTATNGRVFASANRWKKPPFSGPDGFKLDKNGNLFGARPGGLSIFAPDGTHLGSLETGMPASNVAWGEDGSTLFMTGGSSVYRIRLTTKGIGF